MEMGRGGVEFSREMCERQGTELGSGSQVQLTKRDKDSAKKTVQAMLKPKSGKSRRKNQMRVEANETHGIKLQETFMDKKKPQTVQ